MDKTLLSIWTIIMLVNLVIYSMLEEWGAAAGWLSALCALFLVWLKTS